MFSGSITLTFTSGVELREQLRALLEGEREAVYSSPDQNALLHHLATGAPKRCIYPLDPALVEPTGDPRGVLGKPGDGMTFAGPGATTQGPTQPPIEPTKAQVEEAQKISKENAEVIRTASGITEEVRKANQEAAAAAMAAAKQTVEPVKETTTAQKPDPVAPLQEDVTVPAHMELTLETLPKAEYAELLAFCDRHPEVGVVSEKSKPLFFRPLVEMKIKTYLETK